MSLSQAKIDLAVLYKLHEHAEAGGEAIPPREVVHLFDVHVSTRRVELALEELSAKGDIEREYHPHYSDEGLWQVSREGLAKVDRALRVPSSFIARLQESGDRWLESDEAKQAVLKRLTDPMSSTSSTVVPIASVPTVKLDTVIALPSNLSVDWTKWGTILAGVGVLVTVILWYFS